MNKDINMEICALYNSNSIKSMELLFNEYYRSLVLWADIFIKNIPESEDLVHDYIVKLWEKRLFIKLSPITLKSYLYSSIKNASINKIKKKDPLFKYILYDNQFPFLQDDLLEQVLIERIEQEINKLPKRSREVVNLIYKKGKSYKQTAEILGVSISTVKTLLVSSMKKLRVCMTSYKQEIVTITFLFKLLIK